MSREDAMKALAETDWSGATVDRDPRPVSVVHSARMPAELSERLEAEAQRRGLTPGALIRDLVTAGLSAANDDVTVTVRVADLHRVIDSLVHQRVA